MSYYCQYCNYTATNSSNFSHHKKTKKHLQKSITMSNSSIPYSFEPVLACYSSATGAISGTGENPVDESEEKNICNICDKEFKHQSSLYRHRKICQEKKIKFGYFEEKDNSLNLVIDKTYDKPNNLIEKELYEVKLKLEFAEKEKKLAEREKELYKKLEKEKTELLNNFMSNANVLLNKANDNTKITAQTLQTVSISALKYANEKFKNTPALLPIDNFNINNLDFNNEEDKKQLVEILIYNAKQKSLDKLLGDHIIKYYKKENPEEKSFHTTDCSRLNYIVRDLMENALTWSVDKSGLKICKDIVKPLIKKCITALMEHQKELLSEMSKGHFGKQNDVELIIDIIMSIDSGTLEADVNKYIAPYFNLKRAVDE